jgi:hypothetical protein
MGAQKPGPGQNLQDFGNKGGGNPRAPAYLLPGKDGPERFQGKECDRAYDILTTFAQGHQAGHLFPILLSIDSHYPLSPSPIYYSIGRLSRIFFNFFKSRPNGSGMPELIGLRQVSQYGRTFGPAKAVGAKNWTIISLALVKAPPYTKEERKEK